MDQPNRCARGHRCANREKTTTPDGCPCACHGGGPGTPCDINGGCGLEYHRNAEPRQYLGAPCDRALCDTCTQHLASHIRDLTDLYVQLANQLPPGRGGGDGRRAGHPRPGMPIDTRAEALMARAVLVMTSWEEAVRHVAGSPPADTTRTFGWVITDDAIRVLCDRTGMDGYAARAALLANRPANTTGHLATLAVRTRPGTALFTACGYLAGRVAALLALPSTSVARPASWHILSGADSYDIEDLTGADAALEIFALHHRCERAVGLTRQTELLPEPCWTCRVKALVRDTGSNIIRCSACHATITLDDHEEYVYRQAHMIGGSA